MLYYISATTAPTDFYNPETGAFLGTVLLEMGGPEPQERSRVVVQPNPPPGTLPEARYPVKTTGGGQKPAGAATPTCATRGLLGAGTGC